jgi:hypothetical protein
MDGMSLKSTPFILLLMTMMTQLNFEPLSTEQTGDVLNIMIEVSNQILLIKVVEAFFVANINQRQKLAHNSQHFNLDPALSVTSRDILPDSAHIKTHNSFQGNHQVPQLQPQGLMFPNLPNKPRTDKVEYELDYYCSQSEIIIVVKVRSMNSQGVSGLLRVN